MRYLYGATLLLLPFFFMAAAVNAQTTSPDYTNEELYQFTQDIDAEYPDESLYPDFTSVDDIAALPEEERSFLVQDIEEWQEGAELTRIAEEYPSPVQCFDYYEFGSVQAPVYAASPEVVAGTETEFRVSLTNSNPYPVVDANVYVKVFRDRPAGEQSAQLNHVVDQFQALQDISIRANGTHEANFTYQVPASLPSGTYRMVTFVSTAERYNLLGLPFTDDVIGNSSTFTVTGGESAMVRWNRDQVLVDNEQYYFASFAPVEDTTEPIRVSAPVYNERSEPVTADITWRVYRWDQQNDDNLLETETDRVTVAPGDSVFKHFTLTDTDYPVYVVVGEVAYGDATSIINVRFVRDSVPAIRLNYPGVTSYPLTADEPVEVFSCLHSASNAHVEPDGRLELTLTDETGEVFHSYTYDGYVTGAMMGVADSFVPERTYDTFTLTASLYHADELVEEVSFDYTCDDLTDGECQSAAAAGAERSTATTVLPLLAITVGLIGLLVWLVSRRKRTGGTMPPLAGLLFLFIGSALLLTPQGVSAQETSSTLSGSRVSVSAEDRTDGWLYRRMDVVPTHQSLYIRDAHATVHYEAQATDADGTTIVPGSTVDVGDEIEFTPSRGQIDWFAAGYSTDSPLGIWYEDAAFPRNALSNFKGPEQYRRAPSYYSDCRAEFRQDRRYHTPFTVHPAPMSVSVGGTAELAPLGGNRYEVVSPGSVEAVFTYDATYGHYYAGFYERGGRRYDSSLRRFVYEPARCRYPGLDPLTVSYSGNTPYRAEFAARTATINLTAEPVPPEDNMAPNAPTITGPESGIVRGTYTFTIAGNDPDGDNVFYEVDWTNSDIVSLRTPGNSTIESGVERTVERSWGSPTTTTFAARTVDEYGVTSQWTAHTIDITPEVPTTASLEFQVDGGEWSASDQTVAPDATVRVRWDSTNADSCTSAEFDTGDAPSSTTGVPLTLPSPGSSTNVAVTCVGQGGEATAAATVEVSTYPLATVTLASSVSGGPFTDTDKTINPDDTVELQWTSQDAESCTGGSNVNGVNDTSGTTSVTRPDPGNTLTYVVQCFNPAGEITTGSIDVTTLGAMTANLEVSVNGSTPSSDDQTVAASDTVDLYWNSQYADQCTGTGFITGGATSNSSGVAVSVPEPSMTDEYILTCTRPGEDVTDSVTVTTLGLPNLLPVGASYATSSTFSTTTGHYDYVTVEFSARNDGGSDTPSDPAYRISFDKGNTGSFDEETDYTVGQVITAGNTVSQSQQITDVPFGPNRFVIELDPNDTIDESNEGDNSREVIMNIPPPNPDIELTLTQQIIRSGEKAELNWDTKAAYPMNCEVTGQGTTFASFDPSIAGTTGTTTSNPVTAKHIFELSCIEPSTSTEFTDTATVEVVGSPVEF